MRNLFVKGLMATAAVVALASCSNDEEVAMPQGETHDVALGVSVRVMGTKAATGADDVNMSGINGNFAAINGIYVVPMVNGAEQAPIPLGNIEANATNKYSWEKAGVRSDVNGFRVYGNLPAEVVTTIMSTFDYPAPATEDNAHAELVTWMGENMAGKTLIGQYPLLYFANTDIADPDGVKGYYSVNSTSDWDQIANGTSAGQWGSKKTTALGTDNRVKISPVNYGVGVLASGVAYRRTDTNNNLPDEEKIFGEAADTQADQRQTYEDIKSSGTMTLCGVFIQDQPTAIDADLLGLDNNGVLVAAAATAELKTEKLTFSTNNGASVEGANIYAIVTPETSKEVAVSFQFQNTTGKYLFLEKGDVIAPNEYVYYSTTLTPDAGVKPSGVQGDMLIFDADYTTLLNANIIDWSNGTPYLPVTTDVQIGVEIDIEWNQGLSYDVEI